MSKTKSRSSLTKPDQYLGFIKTVHLSGLGIDEANFKIDRDAWASFAPKTGKTAAEISGRHEVVNRRSKSFVVLAHYRVSIKAESGLELAELSCTYSALFSLDKQAEPEFVARFANDEARLVFWPYLRHFISDSTYRMSITPLQLPLTTEMELQRA
jgi:hypothetical protein